jgi:hypothetical protein|tara:strand:+ start:226 stop:471 length:246 start_codon:yes stop_codon:yes gene_type:complete
MMLNIIIIVATAMGLVAFGGLGYTYGLHIAYDVGGMDVYILFASGVGVGVCTLGLWNSVVTECLNRTKPSRSNRRKYRRFA